MRIFSTRSKEEEDRAEETLRESGIDYEIHLDAVDDAGSSVCYLATCYDVKDENAERAKEALRKAGLIS